METSVHSFLLPIGCACCLTKQLDIPNKEMQHVEHNVASPQVVQSSPSATCFSLQRGQGEAQSPDVIDIASNMRALIAFGKPCPGSSGRNRKKENIKNIFLRTTKGIF
jgi:hypothetical protein